MRSLGLREEEYVLCQISRSGTTIADTLSWISRFQSYSPICLMKWLVANHCRPNIVGNVGPDRSRTQSHQALMSPTAMHLLCYLARSKPNRYRRILFYQHQLLIWCSRLVLSTSTAAFLWLVAVVGCANVLSGFGFLLCTLCSRCWERMDTR